MDKFLKAIGYIAVAVISFFLNGAAIQQLWQWFVVPVFHLPVMTFMQCVGLGVVVRYLTFQHIVTVEPEDADTKRLIYCIASPLAALFAGWIVHICM